MKTTSHSEKETGDFAARLAAEIKPGTILLLSGPLGAGKSIFARAMIRSLKQDPTLDVPSPTFTLVQTYDTAKGPVWHFDLYRLESPEEIYEIGWDEALSSGGILLVEWPERLGPFTPAQASTIIFSGNDGEKTRHIEIQPGKGSPP